MNQAVMKKVGERCFEILNFDALVYKNDLKRIKFAHNDFLAF